MLAQSTLALSLRRIATPRVSFAKRSFIATPAFRAADPPVKYKTFHGIHHHHHHHNPTTTTTGD
jgi:hypothetical protein